MFFGLFGFGAFVLPIVLIAAAVSILTAKRLNPPVKLSVVAFWLILALLYIINTPDFPEDYGMFSRMVYTFTEGSRFSGGILGAALGELFHSILGPVGSIMALGAAILILVVLITGRSFVELVTQGANAIGDAASRAKEHYSRQADEDYDDFDEAPSVSRKGKPKLYEMLDDDEPADDLPPVRLIHEELYGFRDADAREELPEPSVGTGPLFQKREIGNRAEIVLFPEKEKDEDSEDFYDIGEGPVVKGLVDLPDEIDVSNVIAEPRVVSFPAERAMAGYVSRPREAKQPGVSNEPMPSYEDYKMPHVHFLNEPPMAKSKAESRTQIMENSRILEETLRSFRIEARVVEVSVGPTVTRYDLSPGPGVKVSSIANLSNDLALSLAAQGIRIEAPIPGKSAVGIEIPNKEPQPVYLKEIIGEERFENYPSKLAFAVGKDIAGEPVVTDIARMPHLLIAGATGSGKSVCINTLIASLLYKARPDEVKLLMIDPKVVELSVYNGIPHLLIPVVTDPKKASGALSWAVGEMESRYNMFAETGCRDLKGFNLSKKDAGEPCLPQIVIIIDELADLMMACKGEVEESICRLAQKARAAGIHLIVATQRPSVDVITGLIKANIPSRLAFAVSSGTDSRTVLDMYGAEKLLGKGDMLFLPMGNNKPVRVQGGFISDKEVETLVSFLKAQAPAEYTVEMIQQVTMPGKANIEGEVDEFFHDAVDFLLTKGKASTSMLQRQFRIGYNRASRLMDELQMRGIVGPEDGVKPRKVTITRDEYHEIYG